MYKSLIIGCGKIAGYFDSSSSPVYSHARAYSICNKTLLSACCDIDFKKASFLSSKYKAYAYSDYIEAIKEVRPDIISVCTPTGTHFQVLSDILKQPHLPGAILLEKPICSDMRQMNELNSLIDESGVPVLVNHSRRFSELYSHLKKKYNDGEYGAPVRTDIFYYGGWENNGTHFLDTLLYLFGGDVSFADVSHGYSERKGDPTLYVHAVMDNSHDIFFHPAKESDYQLFDFDIKFEKARIRVENFEEKVILQKKHVNSMQENILVYSDHNFPAQCGNMLNAANKIVDFLDKREGSIIEEFLFRNAARTMKNIWEAKSLYENRFKQ